MQRKIPRLIPVLLLKRHGLYKTRRFTNATYVGDPINAVRIFNEKEVDELVFLDILASREGTAPNLRAIGDIAGECFMPLCYGGNVTTLTQIEQILKLGVEKIAINSALFRDSGFVREAVREFGASTIVGSVDYKVSLFGKRTVYVAGGTVSTKRPLDEFAKKVGDLGVGEVLLNCIDRDGMQEGYDLVGVEAVCKSVSMPVIACGGAGSIEDMRKAIMDGGAAAAAAGSLFVFVGKHRAVLINYPSQQEIISNFTESFY